MSVPQTTGGGVLPGAVTENWSMLHWVLVEAFRAVWTKLCVATFAENNGLKTRIVSEEVKYLAVTLLWSG